jgi:hypothetical protein
LATQKEGDDLEDTGLDGRIIFDWMLRKLFWDGVDWIDLPQVGSCGGFL